MSIKIKKGSVYDHGQDENSLHLTPSSDVDYKEGDVRGYGSRTLKVDINDPHASQTKNLSPRDNIKTIWGTGSFLLVALLVVAAVVGTFSYKLPIAVLPITVVGALLLLYLLGVMLIPGRLTEKNFVAVLRDFFKWSLAPKQRKDGKGN